MESETATKHFMRTNKYGIKEIIKKPFSYIYMKEVAIDTTGGSVGEYSLLHKKKRSASVRCLTDSHFATMDREGFEKVMLKIKMKESNEIVEFLDQFTFLKELTYNTKAKLAYRLKTKKCVLGQTIYHEESTADKIYLIKNGQFEMSKSIYKVKEKGSSYCEFRRLF